jgi:predicted AlkP superfamily phosphohydrolase/phosphomutase/tetratricopeptide (TPR) repeat protein
MTTSRKVLLVGWDAADWKVINPLMDAGKMPNVQALVEGGVMSSLTTLHPPLSPMLWTSIATGKRPFKHGVHGFAEPTPDGLGVQPVTNLSRKVKAVWNIFHQVGLKSIVVGWWPSQPAEPINGVMVSNHFQPAYGPLEKGWPLAQGSVHPPELRDTLAGLRFHPDEVVGQMLQPFVPGIFDMDPDKEPRLAPLVKVFCECVSIHSAATWLLANQPWDFAAIYYDAIDHFSHAFMPFHPPREAFVPEAEFEKYKHVISAAYQFHDQMLGTLLKLAGEDVTVILMSDHGFHPDHLRPKAVPRIPAGPAIQHRDFGILAMRGAGLKKDELLYGASVLDITPTLLTLYGLPVGEDMDGKVLAGAFEQPLPVRTIPSWEDVAGEDGRHPAETQLDPVAAREALAQLVALGYIAKPDEDKDKTVAKTVRELRYNLGQAYQDDGRHVEAVEIFRELHRAVPDEQRFAVHRFISCQALGKHDEMREVVADLDGRRRKLFLQAVVHVKRLQELAKKRLEERKANAAAEPPAPAPTEPSASAAPTEEEMLGEAGHGSPKSPRDAKSPEPVFTPEERREWLHWSELIRYDPPVVDYLKAQVKTLDREYEEALELLTKVQEAHLVRPGLLLQTADLFVKLGRWEEAEQTYAKALTIDPDNPHAHLGVCRSALRQGEYAAAARSALETLQRLYHFPMAHYLLGVALTRLKDFTRAAQAFRMALTLNPNFPQAHLRLAWLLRRRLGDPKAADEHVRLFRETRAGLAAAPAAAEPAPEAATSSPEAAAGQAEALPELGDAIAVVSGLPRSGTSMVMQMLAAGGLSVLTDGQRQADEDNPRGYLEFEPVKHLREHPDWLAEAKGQVVKVVAPLLGYLPGKYQYRVVFLERNLDEILASQYQMLLRKGGEPDDTPQRRAVLKNEYTRQVNRAKVLLAQRSGVTVLYLNHAEVVRDPQTAARRLCEFFGGRLDAERMATRVQPALHRQRAGA